MNNREDDLQLIKQLFDIASSMVTKPEGVICNTVRTINARDIFYKVPLALASYLNLINSSYVNLIDEHSLNSIARNIIELRNVFHYVCEYKLSKDELNFRMLLADYHGCARELKILKTFDHETKDVEVRCGYILSLIQETDFYRKLSDKQKTSVIKAERPYHWECMTRRKYVIDKKIESGLYDLFSNYTHSFPLSNISQRAYLPETIFSYSNITILAGKVILLYSASLIREYMLLRNTVFRSIIKEHLNTVERCMETENLIRFLNEKKRKDTLTKKRENSLD